jgi:hypothetical protein
MTCRDLLRIHIFGQLDQLIELEERIAGDTRAGREAVEIALDERADDIALELVFEIDNLEWKAELDCDRAGIV